MTPGEYDLELYHGDTYSWRFSLWENAARTIPTDLTGCTANAEIREKPAGSTVVALTTAIVAPNHIDVSLPASLWDQSIPLKGNWDLEVTDPEGGVLTYVAGKVTVTTDVTNSTSP